MVATKKNIIFFFVSLAILFALFFFYKKRYTTKKSLRVYTYSSFVGEYGPGQDLSKLFEEQTGYSLNFISSDSALTMLQKFKNDKKKVDVFIGLDQFSKDRSLVDIEWEPTDVRFDESFFNLFELNVGSKLVPYNWSPMTFIYKKSSVKAPESWQGIADSKITLSIPDPRTSSPGNVYLYWLYNTFKTRFIIAASSLKKHSVWSPSWTTSYGLFTKGTVSMGFSYLTSLSYHWKNNDFDYQAVSFKTGHPVHVEYAGVPKNCNHCIVAKDFLNFMVSPEAQKIIMEKNYMFPVRKTIKKGTVFEDLPQLTLLPLGQTKEYIKNRSSIVDAWKKIQRDNK